MDTLRERWSAYSDRQHRAPSGPIGWLVSERMRRQHAPETAWTLAQLHIQPTDHVLEIGFGAGHGLARMLQHAIHGHVTGIDLSATMVRVARRRNRVALAHGRLAILRGTVAHLPFRHGQFDRIMSIHTLYFWPDPVAICQHIINLLAPGGVFVSTCATAHTCASGERVYWPIQHQIEALVHNLQQPNISAQLISGPDSRQYNNIALVIEKRPSTADIRPSA